VIVLDASAAVEWLLQTSAGHKIENRIFFRSESLHAPHLLDVEVAHVFRRLVRQNKVSPQRAAEAIQDLLNLRLNRYPHTILLPRIWELRHNFSACDAAYLALSEHLGASLLTHDARLGSASSQAARVEVF
jgi:predicted nucleic acid-binding protein